MPIRYTFKTSFRLTERPGWTCSHCDVGSIRLRTDTYLQVETAASVQNRNEVRAAGDTWEAREYRARFVALFACDHCDDPVTVAGNVRTYFDAEKVIFGATEEAFPEDGPRYEVLYPTFVDPAPNPFPLTGGLPSAVHALARRSFHLCWSDRAGAANAVRSCIEEVLTDRGVPRSAKNKKGERFPMSLHARIERYTIREEAIGRAMLAVKWIGNAGSHSAAPLTEDDLRHGFDLLEHVLVEVYEKRRKTLDRLARRITKAKGPLSATRRARG